MHKTFYGKYNGLFRACAVPGLSLGGKGPGDEASITHYFVI